MKLLLISVLAITTAHAEIGKSIDECNELYGERYTGLEQDKLNRDNSVITFKRNFATVVFNRKEIAIEVRYSIRGLNPALKDVSPFLLQNGDKWEEIKPSLGSAMSARKVQRWKSIEGYVAELEDAGSSNGWKLTIRSPERLAEIAERTYKKVK